jgi:hypothetical protein
MQRQLKTKFLRYKLALSYPLYVKDPFQGPYFFISNVYNSAAKHCVAFCKMQFFVTELQDSEASISKRTD